MKEALEKKADPHEIIDDGLIKGIEAVGVKFEKDELFLPEIMVSVNAMKKGMALVEPLLGGEKRKRLSRVLGGAILQRANRL